MSAPANIRRLPNGRDNWRTPPELYLAIQRRVGIRFTLDVAADETNALAPYYFTGPCTYGPDEWCDCGLCKTWCAHDAFGNPPFSLARQFTKKAAIERLGTRHLLVANATDSGWWQEAYGTANLVLHLKGRIAFIDPETEKPVSGNTTGSTLFGWNRYGMGRRIEREWDWKKDLD